MKPTKLLVKPAKREISLKHNVKLQKTEFFIFSLIGFNISNQIHISGYKAQFFK